ncbi:hypothetical protein [Halofilum ochraceum]|uniref:hypothetical protein n=1 Tax=Halofilum ochraceum TaxID=1611323 RepID=UPI0008D91735|nr:hypothetical protein [Halofilum ochraceum]
MAANGSRALPQTAAERQLQEDVAGFYADPYGFVLYAYPWGEPGGWLEKESGPDEWQREFLTDLGRLVAEAETAGEEAEAIQYAIASGHGIGKTAEIAWLIHWFISTRPYPQIVVTAGTKPQLTTKTWRELSKWHRVSINAHWFRWTATSFYHVLAPESWAAWAIPWSKANPDAFAGTHERHVLVIYDEASTIDDVIWETTDGAMTTPGAIWIAFGNPVWPQGRFYDCFNRFKHRWHTRHIDSRTAKKANRNKLDQWVADYGEDSDYVRVRVRGAFPRAGLNQFISSEATATARQRSVPAEVYRRKPLVVALDVARHGDDQSVLTFRRGPKVFPQERARINDLMQVAYWCANRLNEWDTDTVIVDASGMGWGVVDKLRELKFTVVAVQTGEAARDPDHFYNRRVELWHEARKWLKEEGDIPDDEELASDLTTPQYFFDNKQRQQLEKKEDIKERGEGSPDSGDSFVLTFAYPMGDGRKGSGLNPNRGRPGRMV